MDARGKVLTRKCAWCGDTVVEAAEVLSAGALSAPVSHGICRFCLFTHYGRIPVEICLKGCIDTFSIPVAVVDPAMRVLAVNGSAEAAVGYPIPLHRQQFAAAGCDGSMCQTACTACGFHRALEDAYFQGGTHLMQKQTVQCGGQPVTFYFSAEMVLGCVLVVLEWSAATASAAVRRPGRRPVSVGVGCQCMEG